MKNLVILFCAAMCLVAVCGCKSRGNPPGSQEYNAEARALLQEADDIMFAVAYGSYLVKTYPELYELREHLPEARDQKIRVALAKLYDAYKLEPKWADITFAISNCELRLGNADKALEFARHTLLLDPDYFEAHATTALAYTLAGGKAGTRSKRNSCYSEAVKAYKRFIQARPEDYRLEPFQLNIKELQKEMEKP